MSRQIDLFFVFPLKKKYSKQIAVVFFSLLIGAITKNSTSTTTTTTPTRNAKNKNLNSLNQIIDQEWEYKLMINPGEFVIHKKKTKPPL